MKAVVVTLLVGLVGIVQPVSAGEPAGYSETVLHSFGNGSDGQQPLAGVIDVKGTLYGTTYAGGDTDNGTAFALDPRTNAEKVLYSFGDNSDAEPHDSLIDEKGTLYGTTTGGDIGEGTVFALDLSSDADAEKTLYTFCRRQNCADGAFPIGGLTYVKGTLYGTTVWGGEGANGGTLFSLGQDGGAEKVLYSFCSQPDCADGEEPLAGLVDVNGVLYGTTNYGGKASSGTVFSLDPKTGREKVLHDFAGGSDGAFPFAGLIDLGGILYGTTEYGGVGDCNGSGSGCGTVFSLDLKTGAEKVVYAFCSQPDCADGAVLGATLINVSGTLYGTTFIGGKSAGCDSTGCGTVFSFDPKTGKEAVLYSLCSQPNCTDGSYPTAGLIDVRGKLYGTTSSGGAYNYGTVFMLRKTR